MSGCQPVVIMARATTVQPALVANAGGTYRRPVRRVHERPARGIGDMTKVLVAYASRHGATAGIAERIAQALERRGLEVTLESAASVHEVSGFDAFVIGSAAYMGRWLGDATMLVRRHTEALRGRPVWLFRSGPIRHGPRRFEGQGRDRGL